MNWFDTIIIAIIEGLTEFLPVSSTGHMVIAQALLNVESTTFVKAFTVIIQLGAILSVVVLYWKRFFQSVNFYLKLFVGVIPAVILGLYFENAIDLFLEKVWVVALMLLLGGIVMLFVDKWFSKTDSNQEVTYKKSFTIGIFQCIALIPGVSRSMASIVGGMSQRLTRKNAAEFSFFLAVPTMFGATLLKVYKLISDPVQLEVLKENISTLIIGNVVAFIVAMLAIRFFINFLSKNGFRAFGYYRIVVGAIILILLAMDIDLSLL